MKTLEQRLSREQRVGFELHNHLRIRVEQLRRRATPHELKMKSVLDDLGIPYRFQKGFTAGGVMYVADFYLPKPWKMVIEIDGAYHFSKEGRTKDQVRDRYFKVRRRLRVLHITNADVAKSTAEDIAKKIATCKASKRRHPMFDE